ncbi:MAG: protein kinase [Planctomycetota bacterium]
MKTCLTPGDFERHARGEMDRSAVERFNRHLAACRDCQAAYRAFQSDHQFLANLKPEIRKDVEPAGPDETRPATPRASPPLQETISPLSSPIERSAPSSTGPRDRFPQIEGYQIKRIIGRGGMGVVYEALQEKLNRAVALKLLPAVVSTAHPELITRFKREAAAAARLHHTHIIPIYDFGESRDGYYYAMELLTGQPLNLVVRRLAGTDVQAASTASLAALLTDPEPSPRTETRYSPSPGSPSAASGSSTGTKGKVYYRQVARWMADAAEALHYAHLHGMVHRDIKPGNLMLCTDGRIMILDFGLVKVTGEHSVTATGSLVGSYRYMSPEQIGAKRITVDARSDVYSLGATLYELLTFQPAFPSSEQSELLSQILFKEPTPPRKIVPTVPIDLQTICLKALEKSPGARYQTAKALADDLSSYLRDLAIVARRQGPLRRMAKAMRRRKVETLAISAILLVLGIGTTFVVRSHGREQNARRQAWTAERLHLMKEGSRYWDEENWEAGQRAFQQVLSTDPDDYAALVNLANMYNKQYWAQRDPTLLDQAAPLLDRALVVNPRGKDAWNARGVLYEAWNRPAEAIEAYKKVRDLDENYYPAWVNLAMLYGTAGDLAEAERCALKGVELSESVQAPMPLRILGALQLHLGRSEAIETLTLARSVSKNEDVTPLILLAKYHLAQTGEEHAHAALDLAISAGTLAETGEVAGRESPKRFETLPRAKRILALARLRNEQWKAATEAAEQALAAGDEPVFARLILAIATAHGGDLSTGAEHLQLAEASWPEQLKHSAFRAREDGRSLWFDTAEELRQLREQARTLLEPARSGDK